ncbi:Nucleoside-diphosphate-sugar epimerase [Micrococcus luteus]|uniref:Nucleoside-diphosphate-sugar epimerase n=1 Tax=Micrococcus luteus TaxID=1270 RepID=A0ABD7MBP3_MICLU|nr:MULTISPECIES: D-erythronate dehydrogenase [Micrococcus]EFD51228.1 NAD dependent epimerase/dehydratase family protein [Micrococcus luteus SK58]MBU8649418.1 SDR family oxidoreductase [Micrococcus luteus]MCR4488062.1 SDR family oxidoreductase [Micrococcus luteus]MCT1761288.1 SDR family oxidoreductase [Micrococcus luteus]MCV7504618.1 SDR family oxidoreductase [Micrococcus luteus]
MNIVVTGGAGFLGSRVIRSLLQAQDAGRLPVPVDSVVSLDLAPCPVEDPRVSSRVGDMADPAVLAEAITADTAGIFHLAAVLSGGAEQDFNLALRVNVDATERLLEAARGTGARPRFVFTSSLAVFGSAVPTVVPEDLATQPESTYGATKAIGELLVNEYSRKGYVDGRVCRLPTISVRPGKPNSAASSFASGIIREPLQGLQAELPVPEDTRMWLSSPDTAVQNLVHAFIVESERLGGWRVLNIPGVSVTVAEMLDALEAVGGPEARARVVPRPDQRVMDIVCSWPGEFDVERTLSLGFRPDSSFEAAVRQFHREFVA